MNDVTTHGASWSRFSTGILTVDLDAILANWRKLEKSAVPAECAAVVKANAYGCGAEQVSRALAKAGCKTFFVATVEEAAVVRAAVPQATVYALGGFFQQTGDAYAKIDCKPVIGDLNELAEWDVFCRRSGWSGGAAIHIDTGMNRLGLTVSEAQGIIPRINAGDHGITLVMSHLVSAELLNNPANARQLASFREIASLFTPAGKRLYRSGGNVVTKGLRSVRFKGPKSSCLPCALRTQCLRHPERTEIRQVAYFQGHTEKARDSCIERMKRKIDSAVGRALYAMRLAIAEPPFAHICRVMGLDRFTLRGKEKVNSQWQLFCTVHNLKKLHRYGEGFA